MEELPLVRLEPAESARLPHGGTLRTPVYMTQARVNDVLGKVVSHTCTTTLVGHFN